MNVENEESSDESANLQRAVMCQSEPCKHGYRLQPVADGQIDFCLDCMKEAVDAPRITMPKGLDTPEKFSQWIDSVGA